MTDRPDTRPAGHPHLDTVLAHGESPRHLLMDHLCRPARLDRALTETYAKQLLDAVLAEAVKAAYDRAITAARAEYLHDDTGHPEDEAYNQAINDAVVAIRDLKEN